MDAHLFSASLMARLFSNCQRNVETGLPLCIGLSKDMIAYPYNHLFFFNCESIPEITSILGPSAHLNILITRFSGDPNSNQITEIFEYKTLKLGGSPLPAKSLVFKQRLE